MSRHSELALLRDILLQPPPVAARSGALLGGLREGEWLAFHPDGTVAVRGEFRRGRRVGTWRVYHPDGEPRVEMGFRDGLPHGTLTAWWPGGAVALRARFEGGDLVDRVVARRRDGRPFQRVMASA